AATTRIRGCPPSLARPSPRRTVCAPGTMAFSFYRRPAPERRKIMSFFSRLRARLTGHSRNRRTRRREPRSRFFAHAAQIETLEQRCRLSGLVVTSAADSGPGSLRAEIAAAHDGDTITFDPHIFDFNPTDHTIKLDSDELEIHTNLTIQGPGATNLAISGGNQ